MLQGAVRTELRGIKARCRYLCASEIGCDDCILKDLSLFRPLPESTFQLGIGTSFIQTSRSPSSLRTDTVRQHCRPRCTTKPLTLSTISVGVHPTPPVISAAMRCVDQVYDFVWRAGANPYFRKLDGTKINLLVRDYVPYIPASRRWQAR